MAIRYLDDSSGNISTPKKIRYLDTPSPADIIGQREKMAVQQEILGKRAERPYQAAIADIGREAISPLISGLSTGLTAGYAKEGLRAVNPELLSTIMPEQKTLPGKAIRAISEGAGTFLGAPAAITKAAFKEVPKFMMKGPRIIPTKFMGGIPASLAGKVSKFVAPSAVSGLSLAPNALEPKTAAEQVGMGAAFPVALKTVGTGVKAIANAAGVPGKVLQNLLFGKNVSEYGRAGNWGKIASTSPEVDNLTKEQFTSVFKDSKNVVGQKLDGAVSAVKGKVNNAELQREISGVIDNISQYGNDMTPSEAKKLDEMIRRIRTFSTEDNVSVKSIWDMRKDLDKFTRNFKLTTDSAKDAYNQIRRVLNSKIRGSSPSVDKQMNDYEFITKVEEELGSKFEGIIDKNTGKVSAQKAVDFIDKIFANQPKEEVLSDLSKISKMSGVDIIDRAKPLAARRAIERKNRVGLTGEAIEMLAEKPTLAVSSAIEGLQKDIGNISEGAKGLVNKYMGYSPLKSTPAQIEKLKKFGKLRGLTIEDVSRNHNVEPKQNALIRTGNKILGRENTDEMVARERFDIPNLKKISFGGSDRDVYDLGDGNVLKVAKNGRGLMQNANSTDYYAEDAGLIPKTIEVGKNYVVKEKVNLPDYNVKKMISELKKVGPLPSRYNQSNEAYNNKQKIYDILEKHGYPSTDLANYDWLSGDLTAIRQWGTKEGKPILLDEGTLNHSFVDEYRNGPTGGTKHLNDPDFRNVYYQSRNAKKRFGDMDKKTMYGGIGIASSGLALSATQSQAAEKAKKSSDIDMDKIYMIESSGNPKAFNKGSKARGLGQITPIVLKDWNNLHPNDRHNENDLFDPEINKKISQWYMNDRIPKMFKSKKIKDTTDNRLVAYNFGIGNIGKKLPPETEKYLKKYKGG